MQSSETCCWNQLQPVKFNVLTVPTLCDNQHFKQNLTNDSITTNHQTIFTINKRNSIPSTHIQHHTLLNSCNEKAILSEFPSSKHFSSDDFQILDCCGQGGIGTVYKAKNKQNEQILAIKVCEKQHIQSTQNFKRLVNEANIMSDIQHQNIVQYHGAFESSEK